MRTLLTIIILVAIFTTPYWVYLPLGVFAFFAFPFYFEALIFGALIDALYGAHQGYFDYAFTLSAAALLLLSVPLRSHIRLHAA